MCRGNIYKNGSLVNEDSRAVKENTGTAYENEMKKFTSSLLINILRLSSSNCITKSFSLARSSCECGRTDLLREGAGKLSKIQQ